MIFHFIILAVIAFVLFVIHRFFIKPYLGVLFYKKQGFSMKFYPMGTGLLEYEKDAVEKGDYFYQGLKLIEKDPKIKGFGFNTMEKPHIFLNDVNDIKEFILNIKDFDKADLFYPFKKYAGEGLVLTDLPKWRRHRKILSTVFHYEYLTQMVPLSANISKDSFIKWQDGRKTIKNIDILHLFTNINGEIVGQLFFGDKFSKYTLNGLTYIEMVEKLMLGAFIVAIHPAQLIFGPKFMDSKLMKHQRDYFKILDDFYQLSQTILENKLKEIKEMRENGTYQSNPQLKKSLVELLYEMRENKDQENSFTNEEIIHEFTTFFTAGTDTTSHLVYMAAYYYVNNPQCHQRLLDEVKEHFKPADELTGDDLNKMAYMNAFLKETLRLFGPSSGHFEKQANCNVKVGDVNVKKGTLVNIQFPVLHQNHLYYEEPETFKPERWLDPNSKTMQSVKNYPYCYIPFYAGPKNCIGQNMAMMSAKIILSHFIKTFSAKMSDPNYEMKRTIKFMVCPLDTIHLDLKAK